MIRFAHPSIADYRARPPKVLRDGGRAGWSRRSPAGSGELLVSIVTSVRNGERFLAEAIQSVLAQSYRHIEYIIVDGVSTDRTLAIVQSFGDRIDYWMSAPDRGPFDGMNRGIALASGHLVKIHGADDVMPPDSVDLAVDAYRRAGPPRSDCIIRGDMEVIDERGEPLYTVEPSSRFLADPAVLHPTWYVPMPLYERFGLYDPHAPVSSDYEMFFYLQAHGVSFLPAGGVLSQFRTGGASATYAGVVDTFRINHRYRGLGVAAYVATSAVLTKSGRQLLTRAIGERRYSAAKKRLRAVLTARSGSREGHVDDVPR